MLKVDGSLARSLDFGNITSDTPLGRRVNPSPARSRLHLGLLHGADKYRMLEKRRRVAQIKARHALDRVSPAEGDR
jgi:hypothetical protein